MSIAAHSKNGVIYIEDITALNLPTVQKVSRYDVDEHEVDAACKDNFVAAGFDKSNVSLGNSGIATIDKNIPSKGLGGGKGKLDACLVENDKLLILVEDKVPSKLANEALQEATAYCDGLIKSNASDVRIAVGYNGIEAKWRVRVDNAGTGFHTWEPFLIKNVECECFPTPDLVALIYNHINCHRIIEDRSNSSKKALETCIGILRQKYRQLSFIQNDNHTAIDFTIAFISLKSILEKHGNLLPSKPEWRWNGLPGSDTSALKVNITTSVKYICDKDERAKDAKGKVDAIDLAKNFGDIFYQKDKNRTFDFAALIDEFRTSSQLEALKAIYDAISILPALHSSRIDLFGETYELLADKKTKAAFGQYFTGRHIIRPLIQLLLEDENFISLTGGVHNGKAKTPKKICDPACGTGGFLTEAFKHINDKFSADIDVNDFAKHSFFGYDVFPANVTKTKINLYLAGDGFSDLDDRDTLTARIDNHFDYIITNPPYGKGDTLVAADVIGSNRLEVNFLIRIVQMLQIGGKALVIIPDGVLEAPSLAPLREWLIKQCSIDKIIGLPKFAFAPYTKEKTYALFITKRSEPIVTVDMASKQHEKIWYYIVDNDGYANSDKRFPTARKDSEGRWLHDELSDWSNMDGEDHDCLLIQRWRQKVQRDDALFNDEWGNAISGKKFGYVEMADVLKQEFTTYATVTNTEVLKIVHSALIPQLKSMTDGAFDAIGLRTREDGSGNRIYEKPDGSRWKAVSETTVLKLVIASLKTTGEIPCSADDLFLEDGAIKPEYAELLASKKIVHQEEDKQFINQGKATVTRLLNLIPEKYFRSQSPERVAISDLQAEIDGLEADFNSLLATLAPKAIPGDSGELE
jgi:type I restriction enzyme M protein